MDLAPIPQLLFPSCADCARIGLRQMPEMLRDMERDVGADAVRTFLIAFGGREFMAHSRSGSPRSAAEEWMDANYTGMKVAVPKGPASHSARLAWTIHTRLKESWSIKRIAEATGCHMRTISYHKKRLRPLGVLAPATCTFPQHHQETPEC